MVLKDLEEIIAAEHKSLDGFAQKELTDDVCQLLASGDGSPTGLLRRHRVSGPQGDCVMLV